MRPRMAPTPQCCWPGPGTPRSAPWNATPGPAPRRSPATSPGGTRLPGGTALSRPDRRHDDGTKRASSAAALLHVEVAERGEGEPAVRGVGGPERPPVRRSISGRHRGRGGSVVDLVVVGDLPVG